MYLKRPHPIAPSTLFDMFSPIIHTKTPVNTDENEDFRKRFQKWRRLKTLRFKCGQVKTEAFGNGDVNNVTCYQFQSKLKHLSKMEDS